MLDKPEFSKCLDEFPVHVVFQRCIEKQGLFQNFPEVLLKSSIFQELRDECFI